MKIQSPTDEAIGTAKTQQNGHAYTKGYSKQSDYYVTGDSIARSELVQRPVTNKNN